MTATILVVEDNRDNMELMEYLLTAFGYTPMLALGGAEAIRLRARAPAGPDPDGPPDAGDGRLRGERRRSASEPGLEECTVVAVTAFAMVGDQERILAARIRRVHLEADRSRDLRRAGRALPRAGAARRRAADSAMSSILVLDDRAADRELLATLLGHAGLLGARRRPRATRRWALRAPSGPDLVITDIVMPKMNGYEFVRRLRGDPDTAAIPVVFCTANYRRPRSGSLAAACRRVPLHRRSRPIPRRSSARWARCSARPDARPQPLAREEFDREQLRLLNDKLVEKVGELESAHAERRKLRGPAHQRARRGAQADRRGPARRLRSRPWSPCGCASRRSCARTTQPELARELDGLQERRRGGGRAPAAPAVRATAAWSWTGAGWGSRSRSASSRRAPRTGWSTSSRTARRAGPPRRCERCSTGSGVRRWRTSASTPRPHASRCCLDDDSDGFSLQVRDDGNGLRRRAGTARAGRAPRPPGDARAGRDRPGGA